MSKKQLYKVVIIGDSSVGKTSLLQRYVNERFLTSYRATVGADFMTKDIALDDRMLTLQIWDTAGQEKHQSLGNAFYRGADCCILVYDITSIKSFESLDNWREVFLSQGDPKNPETFPFILLGNKADKESDRKVTTAKAVAWCKSHGDVRHYEVSAKDNTGVDDAFTVIAKAASSQRKDEEIYFPVTVKLTQPDAKPTKTTCC